MTVHCSGDMLKMSMGSRSCAQPKELLNVNFNIVPMVGQSGLASVRSCRTRNGQFNFVYAHGKERRNLHDTTARLVLCGLLVKVVFFFSHQEEHVARAGCSCCWFLIFDSYFRDYNHARAIA